MDKLPIEIQRHFDENRRGSARLKIVKAKLEVDGQQIEVNDFSKTGFEAPLPASYQTVGKTGNAILRFSAVGYDIEQEIAFEVVRVTANGNVGATFTVLKGNHKPSAS